MKIIYNALSILFMSIYIIGWIRGSSIPSNFIVLGLLFQVLGKLTSICT